MRCSPRTLFNRTDWLLFAASGKRLVLRENVGRNNVVDKLIGWALVVGLPRVACVSTVSSLAARLG